MAMTLYKDMDVWVRQSRGRTFDFDLQDGEVQDLLMQCLPTEFGPYTLIGTYLEKVGKLYERRFLETKIDQYLELRKKKIWQIFVKSEKITGQIDYSSKDDLNALLPTNGLTIIQVDLPRESPGFAGIINRIINEETGEIVTHVEYEQIFKAMKKAFLRFQKTKNAS